MRGHIHQLYERWAPTYRAEPHNSLMAVEQAAMLERLPGVSGAVTLDLACGTGRYARELARRGARRIVALDFSERMLRQVAVGERVAGEIDRLPLRDGAFDVVISGLALGHAEHLEGALREVARVLRPGGMLLYSDFHPAAEQRGQIRSFRDTCGVRFELPAGSHTLAAHFAALESAGLQPHDVFEPRIGVEVPAPALSDGSSAHDWHELPVLLIVRACKS